MIDGKRINSGKGRCLLVSYAAAGVNSTEHVAAFAWEAEKGSGCTFALAPSG
jgi:hypothetical protein